MSIKDFAQRANAKMAQAQPEQVNGGSTPGYQDDGSYKLDTNVSDSQANAMAARVSRGRFERYMEDFAPQEQKLIGSLGDTKAQDAAKASKGNAIRSRAALDRMRQRYGTSLTGGQQKAETNQNQRNTALGTLSATNSGRQMDEDRNFNLKGTMLNIGNNLSSSAMSGLTETAQGASARKTAYDQAKDQHKAQQQQQAATLAANIAMAAIMS